MFLSNILMIGLFRSNLLLLMIYTDIKKGLNSWLVVSDQLKISGILSHKIPMYIITNAIYFDLEIFLSNILMIGQFCSNNRMVIFSKTEEKSYQSKHEKHHIFMTSTSKGEGGILKFVTNLQILLFF